MYERLSQDGPLSRKLPFPLYELPMDETPIDPLLFPTVMHTLLKQSAGLASTIYSATFSDEMPYQDATQALHVLSEWLNTTLAVWERWEAERAAGRLGKAEGG